MVRDVERRKTSFKLIAIGGSAGSIDVLTQIVPQLRPALGSAVVCVMHMPPDAQSLLAEIFSPRTEMKIKEAESTEPIHPSVFYFAPPGYHLSVEADHSLSLSNEEAVHYSRPSIDLCFDSIARAYGPDALGLLLTGANADGARGLATMQEHGAFTIVQEPKSAAHPEMPLAALELFKPDLCLAPHEIADFFCQLAGRQESLPLLKGLTLE